MRIDALNARTKTKRRVYFQHSTYFSCRARHSPSDLRLIAVSNISVVTKFLSDMKANCAVGD